MSKCHHGKKTAILFFRVIVGIVFLSHGYQKLSNMDQTVQFFNMLHFGSFLAHLVAWIETLGGVALILGIFIPVFAPLLAIVMVVAILSLKRNEISFNGFGKAEFEFVLLGSTLLLSSMRSGVCSLSKICGCKCHIEEGKSCGICKFKGCEKHSEKTCS
ncbi:MAG: DoxX family protein [Candidatus Paceibacterota bacterium]